MRFGGALLQRGEFGRRNPFPGTLVQNSACRRISPRDDGDQATFPVVGMPRLVMGLMTAQATLASAFCAGRVRARRLRPIGTLNRSIATSTNDLLPYWTARCQPSRPRSLIVWMWRSRRVGALWAVSLTTAVARGGMITSASGARSATAR